LFTEIKRARLISNRANTLSTVMESHYLETLEGMFFAVKGLEHPPERIVAVLRYVRDPDRGDRFKDGMRYRRLYQFAEQEALLKKAGRCYLAHDEVFGTTLQSVPRSSVRRSYDPRLRLRQLYSKSNNGIEEDAVAFARLLENEAGIQRSSLGITGSLLIGLHTDMSDLDFSVFGIRDCRKVYGTLRGLLETESCSELCRLDSAGMKELYRQRNADTPMSFKDFADLEKRKVNQGSFRKRTYFIRFIEDIGEWGEGYGFRHYTPMGRARISASIADAQKAIFTPCRYMLAESRSTDGTPIPVVEEITSFRGRFCEQARTGETVIAEGTLERVQTQKGETWCRLLLGNSPNDTMIVQH
jgi:predicted nucleotidyltransferase